MGGAVRHSLVRLLRLHQPAGILLLFWPAAWSLVLHSETTPWRLLALFFIGAVFMRSFGCVVNDLTDRKYDAQVERTKTRPLASGELSLTTAKIVACVLLVGAAGIALCLGWKVVVCALAALPLVVAYPFMKRITFWPQAFLGITFGWGALLGCVAATGGVTFSAVLLWFAAACWTFAYDTIYAYQDREDDVRIGVKSSARALGEYPRVFLSCCYGLSCAFMLWAGIGIIGVAAFACLLVYQVYYLNIADSAGCLRLFKLNAWLGWLPLCGLLTL